MRFSVGDRVRTTEAIYEPADDHSPGGYLTGKGDILIVREVRENSKYWPYSVSHEDRTDGKTFSCAEAEIELAD